MQFTQGQIVQCACCKSVPHGGRVLQSLGNDMYLVDCGYMEPIILHSSAITPQKEHHV